MEVKREEMLVYLSVYIADFDNLLRQFEDIYKRDTERYYLNALHSNKYNDGILNDSSILHNNEMKRVFGVLVTAEEDNILRKKVVDTLLNFDKVFSKFVDKPNMVNFRAVALRFFQYPTAHKQQAGLYIAMYLAIDRYGTDREDSDYQTLLRQLNQDIERHENYSTDKAKMGIQNISDPFQYLSVDKDVWSIIKKIKTGEDLFNAMLVMEELLVGKNNEEEGGEIYKAIIKYINKGGENTEDYYKAAHILFTYSDILPCFGFSAFTFLHGINLKKEEQMLILKAQAFMYYNSRLKEKAKIEKLELSLEKYITYTIIYMLIKQAYNTKQYYEENNNETLFSQIKYYREDKEIRDQEIEQLNNQIEYERKQNELLRQQVGATTDTRPFMEEISALNHKVRELERELEQERRKATELNALREFVFDIKSQYVPEEDKTDLKELVKGKKIVIIGGHIEWRNKLKNKYPSITVMDGHNPASDFSVINNADLVLLNTSNMSHIVYYKIIDVLRNGNIRYNYLGRTINQELFEKEIADIITKQNL